jgi:NAD(P)H-hydrate repair Nnr-like enzyme with NAD(P)H-hydrate epimerase domain
MSALDFVRVARAAGARLSADGASLVVEAEDPLPPQVFDMLRAHKPEILELLHAQRRAVVRYVNEQFQSSPLGQCAYCGGGSRSGDAFVAMFAGENRADIHAMCHPAWIAAQEARARVALGIDAQVGDGAVKEVKEEHARAGRERG